VKRWLVHANLREMLWVEIGVLPCVLKEFKYLLPSAHYFLLLGLRSHPFQKMTGSEGHAYVHQVFILWDMRWSMGLAMFNTYSEMGWEPEKCVEFGLNRCVLTLPFWFSNIFHYIPFIKACPAIDAQMTQMLIDVYHSYANPFSATCWNMLKQSWGHLNTTEPATHATWQVTDWWVVEECNKPCGGGEVGWGMRR